MQRAVLRLPRQLSRRAIPSRALSTTAARHSSPFETGPAPPRLPKEEQELFEKLQRQSTGAFSTPRTSDSTTSTPDIRSRINQSPDSTPSAPSHTSPANVRVQINQSPDSSPSPPQEDGVGVDGKRIEEGDEFHPNMRRGAPPEFEGDVNPKTGEVGGPKNEPLRWGVAGDWSYNGRVTDF